MERTGGGIMLKQSLMGSCAALPDTAWTNSPASQWADILKRQHKARLGATPHRRWVVSKFDSVEAQPSELDGAALIRAKQSSNPAGFKKVVQHYRRLGFSDAQIVNAMAKSPLIISTKPRR